MKHLLTQFGHSVGLASYATVGSPSADRRRLLLKHITFMLLFLLAGVGQVWGATYNHTWTSTETITVTNNKVTLSEMVWNIATTVGKGSPTIGNVVNGYQKPGWQIGNNANNHFKSITLSTEAFSSYNVTSVKLLIRINGAVSTTIGVSQGDINIGSNSVNTAGTWHDLTANTNSGEGGTLTISITTSQAIFINSIIVTYDDPGSTEPTD